MKTASDLFYRYGIHAVGVDTIASEAGTNKMSFYRNCYSVVLIGARAQWIAPEGRCLRQSATPERDGSHLRRDFPEPFRKPYVRAQRIAKGLLAVRPILTGHACNQRTRRQQSRRCRPLCVRLGEKSRNRLNELLRA